MTYAKIVTSHYRQLRSVRGHETLCAQRIRIICHRVCGEGKIMPGRILQTFTVSIISEQLFKGGAEMCDGGVNNMSAIGHPGFRCAILSTERILRVALDDPSAVIPQRRRRKWRPLPTRTSLMGMEPVMTACSPRLHDVGICVSSCACGRLEPFCAGDHQSPVGGPSRMPPTPAHIQNFPASYDRQSESPGVGQAVKPALCHFSNANLAARRRQRSGHPEITPNIGAYR